MNFNRKSERCQRLIVYSRLILYQIETELKVLREKVVALEKAKVELETLCEEKGCRLLFRDFLYYDYDCMAHFHLKLRQLYRQRATGENSCYFFCLKS